MEAMLSEKEETEAALREMEVRYRALFEQAADSILLFDAATAAPVAFNDRACAELGYTRDEMQHLSLSDIEAKESLSDIRRHFGDIIRNGSDTFETQVKTKKGEIRTYWTIAKAISIGGKTFIQAIARDITERKKMEEKIRFSEERLKEAQSLAQMGSWDRDLRTGEIFQSEGLYRLFGYEPGEVVLSNELLDSLIHPAHKGLFKDFLENTFSGTRSANYEFCFFRKDGAKRYAFAETNIIRDRTGKPIRVSGTLKDITEFKLAEMALKEKEKELQDQADRLREVNTALKVLLSHLEAEKAQLKEDMQSNIKKLILPYLERLKNMCGAQREKKTMIEILESNLSQIASSFSTKLSSRAVGLTPRELEVASLVRDGLRSKEIAHMLCISENAVRFHRYNIRRKLGLQNKGLNLRSYLQNISL